MEKGALFVRQKFDEETAKQFDKFIVGNGGVIVRDYCDCGGQGGMISIQTFVVYKEKFCLKVYQVLTAN